MKKLEEMTKEELLARVSKQRDYRREYNKRRREEIKVWGEFYKKWYGKKVGGVELK